MNSRSTARASFSRFTPGFGATASIAPGGSGGSDVAASPPQPATSRTGSSAATRLGKGRRGIDALSSFRLGTMATAKRSTARKRRIWPQALFALFVLGGVLAWYYREPIDGYAETGAAFGARTACSCRYVAGRPIGDCKKDFEAGMEVVFLSDDEEAKAVTARVPLRRQRDRALPQGFRLRARQVGPVIRRR